MASRTGRTISDQQPLVAHVERAAQLLEVDEHELGAVIDRAGLQPWGAHASGAPVYRWVALVEVAASAGLPLSVRRVRHAWRRRPMVGPS